MIEPWGGDLDLLRALLRDPAMMEHLGGPETEESIRRRQSRYERPDSGQFRITTPDAGGWRSVGWVGYWEREWREQEVYELGWSVLPGFQGRGLAREATRDLLTLMAREGARTRRYAHAFPNVDNAASNAICRTTGFTLLGPTDFEYPKGSMMRCHDWRFDLDALA